VQQTSRGTTDRIVIIDYCDKYTGCKHCALSPRYVNSDPIEESLARTGRAAPFGCPIAPLLF
jgi:hypothetical protein